MRHVLVVGIGAGDPAHMTAAAVDALNKTDVIFEIARGTEDLTAARRAICERYLTDGHAPRIVTVEEPARDRMAPDYRAAVQAWRRQRAEVWERAIADELTESETGAFLVWGDPSLYDSTIDVLDELRGRGRVAFDYEVIPGISSIHALTARHGITLNRVGRSVLITTGRRLAEHGLPDGVDDVVVMLDGGCAFRHLTGEPLEIY